MVEPSGFVRTNSLFGLLLGLMLMLPPTATVEPDATDWTANKRFSRTTLTGVGSAEPNVAIEGPPWPSSQYTTDAAITLPAPRFWPTTAAVASMQLMYTTLVRLSAGSVQKPKRLRFCATHAVPSMPVNTWPLLLRIVPTVVYWFWAKSYRTRSAVFPLTPNST